MTQATIKGHFRGDHPALVDALVEASQRRPSGEYTGFGRELVPVDSAWLSEPLQTPAANKGKQSPARSPNPKQSKRKGSPPEAVRPISARPSMEGAPQQVQAQPRAASARDGQSRGAGKQRGNAQVPLVPAFGIKGSFSNLSTSPPMNIPKRFPQTSNGKSISPARSVSPSAGFACPGIFASPQPRDIPIPMGLLMRANAMAVPPAAA
eukprot:CAMPEP_0202864646 /NCGR_PEP_ID=MMETSP1391-20130828/4794_1 /ASSEMBLY_ACC=CAM_ASM_000867 /TAXON_ID=1034604 /ORGANISM="Chlamydomonas leiostraca, Strain SAG 11-49" /LENGTH=207 /DNA_ID=CAMNT_0049544411 /DNA_START=119 /DNA_END=742 /DNA_ORIENTATION=+